MHPITAPGALCHDMLQEAPGLPCMASQTCRRPLSACGCGSQPCPAACLSCQCLVAQVALQVPISLEELPLELPVLPTQKWLLVSLTDHFIPPLRMMRPCMMPQLVAPQLRELVQLSPATTLCRVGSAAGWGVP